MDSYDAIGVGPAYKEAYGSRLPGRHNGPADAYRHILGAAEMTRRHGEKAARAFLAANEIKGEVSGQPDDEWDMDWHNNEIGISIGKEAKNFDEVIAKSREKIDEAVNPGGESERETAKWLDSSRWGAWREEKAPNWPPDWSQVEPSKSEYEYGGEEHRYGYGNPDMKPGSGDTWELGPMSRPIESWSEDDVQAVMNSDVYWRRGMPGHEQAQSKVASWFRHFYGDGLSERDITGRNRDPQPIRAIPSGGGGGGRGGGPVHVSAHSREGGKIQVSSYSRSAPS